MSGPGPGPSDYSVFPSPPRGGGKDPCNITEITVLNSPDKAVISKIKDGDKLEVVYVPGPPQQLLAEWRGQKAGSITSTAMTSIINCIDTIGREYEAQVLSIRGALCQIRIQPK